MKKEIIIIENDSYNSTNAAALLDYDNFSLLEFFFNNLRVLIETIVSETELLPHYNYTLANC